MCPLLIAVGRDYAINNDLFYFILLHSHFIYNILSHDLGDRKANIEVF